MKPADSLQHGERGCRFSQGKSRRWVGGLEGARSQPKQGFAQTSSEVMAGRSPAESSPAWLPAACYRLQLLVQEGQCHWPCESF